MKSVIDLFKKSLKFPAIWIGVIYLFWWLFTFTNDAFRHGTRILSVYFIITILEILLLLSKNKAHKVALFVILLCLTLFSLVLAIMEPRWISYAPSYRFHLIYIPLIIIFSGYKAYDLFRSHLSPGKILSVLLFIVTFPVLEINIAYPISFFPEIVDKEEFGDFKYYIVWQKDIEYRSSLSLYKCKKESFSCSWLYSDSQRMNWDKILIDKKKNEVSIVRGSDSGLAYTDGDNPRRYEVDSVQLGDHVYQMATDDHEFWKCMTAPSCDSYTYILYECNLDYTSCDPLPVQYITANEDVIFLNANEVTGEINASNDRDTLIFTYGEHPVCYVNDCVILDQ